MPRPRLHEMVDRYRQQVDLTRGRIVKSVPTGSGYSCTPHRLLAAVQAAIYQPVFPARVIIHDRS